MTYLSSQTALCMQGAFAFGGSGKAMVMEPTWLRHTAQGLFHAYSGQVALCGHSVNSIPKEELAFIEPMTRATSKLACRQCSIKMRERRIKREQA